MKVGIPMRFYSIARPCALRLVRRAGALPSAVLGALALLGVASACSSDPEPGADGPGATGGSGAADGSGGDAAAGAGGSGGAASGGSASGGSASGGSASGGSGGDTSCKAGSYELNFGSGTCVFECVDGEWEKTIYCSYVSWAKDDCNAGEYTLSGTKCGLTNEGKLLQWCVEIGGGSSWSTEEQICVNGGPLCEEGTTRNSDDACGLNGEGFFVENCEGGKWVTSETCTGKDVCTNGYIDITDTTCGTTNEGFRAHECVAGKWVNDALCVSKTEQLAFVSSVNYTGDLGGLAGADAKCQELAAAANLPGTYKAWLSDGKGNSPDTRFAKARVPYKLVNGTVIADHWGDLTDGELKAAIDVTEKNGAPLDPTHDCYTKWDHKAAWTNTAPDGKMHKDTDSCTDWTSTEDTYANMGTYSSTDAWSSVCSEEDCHNTAALLCFQQWLDDCAGVKGGSAKEDSCGTCDSNPANDCTQ